MAFDLVGKAVKILRLPTVDYLNAPIKIIPAQQNDVNSRYFKISLYDDRGDIDFTGYKAILSAALPNSDDIIFTNSEVSDDGKYITCCLSADMTKEAGRVRCEIMLFKTDPDGEGNGSQIASQSFYVQVASSISSDEAIEGSTDYGILLDTIEKFEQAEKARVEAEEARVQAEAERVAAESERISNETEREDTEAQRIQNEETRM